MSDATPPPNIPPSRAPRIFEPGDPALVRAPPEPAPATEPVPVPATGPVATPAPHALSPAGRIGKRPPLLRSQILRSPILRSQVGPPAAPPYVPAPGPARRRLGWAKLLAASLMGLVLVSAGLAFARTVAELLNRDDWIGWTASALAATAALAAVMIVARESLGVLRLSRLRDIRRETATALASGDRSSETRALLHLRNLYRSRPDLRWGLERLESGLLAAPGLPGDKLRLAEREVLIPLDASARRLILRSTKRIATVTTLSPVKALTVGFVLIENIRLLASIAGLYGGRPGPLGALRLARLVAGHLIATGGIALTDDLLGQMLGHGLVRRLSARLGEGAFNGALTARVGAAGVEVCRPLPFLDARPVRARDVLRELFRKEAIAPEQV